MGRRVMIVGAGFIGSSLAKYLEGNRLQVTIVSRMPVVGLRNWLKLDATDRDACARIIQQVSPDSIILVHGPSVIEWCEANPQDALRIHQTIAANFLTVSAESWHALISTDNVFPGDKEIYSECDSPAPINAYGEAKLAAERLILSQARNLVCRISLTYGWPAHGHRDNYLNLVIKSLKAGQPVSAPVDQWVTPIYLHDCIECLKELTIHQVSGVLHLGGPERVSRFDWANKIADVFDLNRSLILPVSKADTTYSCRPTNTCLTSERYERIDGLRGIELHDVIEGARLSALCFQRAIDTRLHA